MTVCGTPDEEFMKKITSEEARNYIRTLPTMKKRNYKEIFRDANPEGNAANNATLIKLIVSINLITVLVYCSY